VSYALNGLPGVSEATRQRIMAIAAEAGWQPNFAARALSAARSGACGLVLARPAGTLAYEPFFAKLLSGIEAELSAREVALTLQIANDLGTEVAILRRWWTERRVDGVLLVDLRVDDPRIPVVEEIGLPAVVVGGPGDTGGVPFAASDDAGGTRQIVEHLVVLGHRRIARVAGPPEFAHTLARTVAFEKALADAGASGRVVPTDLSSAASARATAELLAGSPPPTAIIYDSDIMAVAGLGTAQELGLAVPRELSIVSYDDSPICELVRPALTACVRDVVAYGARSARALLAVLAGEQVGPQVEETPRLVTRASSAVPV
jgi:DNA-binding LacI/PurR family transcriptional regulator